MGFKNEFAILATAMIFCNGDFELLTKAATPTLTWYEEWFIYFEIVWGISHTKF